MKIGRDFLDIFYDAIYGKIGLNLGIVEEKSIKKNSHGPSYFLFHVSAIWFQQKLGLHFANGDRSLAFF